MSQASIKYYWEPSWKMFYEAYYQELASEALLVLWERINTVVMFTVALTASGSAIAGWSLWDLPGWKVLWIILAGIASIGSIAHTTMRVPSQIKSQEELRSKFSKLRFDIETFRQHLRTGLNKDQAGAEFDELRKRQSEYIEQTHPDILYSLRFRSSVQKRLHGILKEKGILK